MRPSLSLLCLLAVGCIKNDIPHDARDWGSDEPASDAMDEDNDGFDASVDCNDNDPAIHPDAAEVCDGIDNDCDAHIDADDEDAEGLISAFKDNDGDGSGDPAAPVDVCGTDEAGVSPNGDDCNDADTDVFPGQDELCDGVDNDCDGLTDASDPGLVDGITFWIDADNDTYGDATDSVTDCTVPEGYADNALDCDDTDELEGQPSEWYVDSDADGFGSEVAGVACDPEPSWSAINGDCNDDDAAVNPDEIDYCGDDIDTDCSGEEDDWGPDCINLEPQDIIDDLSCVSEEIEFISTGFDVEGDHFSISYGPSGNWVNHDTAAGLEIKPTGTTDFTEVIYAGTELDFALFENDGRTHPFGHPSAFSLFYDIHCSANIRRGDVIGAVHTLRRSFTHPSGFLAYIDLTKKELWNEADESVLIEYSAAPSTMAGSVSFTVQRFLDFDIDWYSPLDFFESGTDFDTEGRISLSTGPITGTTVAIGACGSDSAVGSVAEWSWSPVTTSITDEFCNADSFSSDTPTIIETELTSTGWSGHPKKRFVMSIGASPSAASSEWNAAAEPLCGDGWEPSVVPSYSGGFCDGRIVIYDPSPEL